MNVILKTNDSVNASITIDVVKEDYTNKVEKSIKDLRKNAVLPGFRKGMAPLSRIQQMYGKSVLAEELNKLVGDKLNAFIKEEKLNILTEPFLSSGEPQVLELDKEDYSFTFDVGLMPPVEFQLSKEDKIPFYLIEITDAMIDQQINNLKVNYGSHDSVEEVEGKDIVNGLLTELDENGEPKADGIRNDDALLMPEYIKNEEEKAKFIGAKLGATIVFNPHKAYEGNAAELASFLRMGKDAVEHYTGNFSLEIKEITRYREAEINQELFDKLFEPGTVTDEETFRAKIKDSIAQHLILESDYKFLIDVYKYLEEKVGEPVFPEAFLKRHLQNSSTSKTPETIDADYRELIKDLTSQAIRKRLIKDYKITVTDKDIFETAQKETYKQFARYGMANAPDHFTENYIREMLKKEEMVHQLVDNFIDTQLTEVFKKELTMETQTVTLEEFQRFFKEETK